MRMDRTKWLWPMMIVASSLSTMALTFGQDIYSQLVLKTGPASVSASGETTAKSTKATQAARDAAAGTLASVARAERTRALQDRIRTQSAQELTTATLAARQSERQQARLEQTERSPGRQSVEAISNRRR